MQVFLWFSHFISRRRRSQQLREAQRWQTRLEARPGSLALEPRRVLNAAPIVAPVPTPTPAPQVAEVVVNAGQFANDGKADTFVVTQTAAGDVVSVNGQVQQVVAPGTQLVIEGSSDSDQVQIISTENSAGGNSNIDFVGNGGNDTIQLSGAAQSVVHQFTPDGTGRVTIDGTSIAYSAGVDINDAIQTSARTFELDGAQDFELTDSTTAGFDEARGQYGQNVRFAESSSTLRVDAAQETPAANQVTVQDLDSSLQRHLEIDGDTADTVNLAGELNLHSGDLSVTAGAIDITGRIQTENANVDFSATSQLTIADEAEIENHGGAITADAGPQGALLVAGKLDVSDLKLGQTGGAIHLLGDQVQLIGADVDARGNAGGGTILIGGDYQGKNPQIRNASQTVVDQATRLDASAVETGNGGKVIVWANEAASFTGTIIARGGAQSGDGGFVETSGKAYLYASGRVDAGATHGAAGTWLLDPANITIDNSPDANGSFDAGSPNTFTPSADDAVADIATIEASLNSGTNVVVTTAGKGAQPGDITVVADITKTAGADATLTLDADHDIIINSGVTISSTAGKLNVDLDAANEIVTAGAIINTNDGDVTAHAAAGAITLGTVNTGTGNLSAKAAGAVTDAAGAVLTIGGNAGFQGSSITLDNAAANAFGTLSFNSAGAVTIVENDATNLTGANTANSLSLTSAGAITDAAGTSVSVTNNGTLTGVGVTLADQLTDVLSIGGNADFEGGTGAVLIGYLGMANFGSLTFNSTSSVTIQEDSAMNVTGVNTAGGLSLASAGAITDAVGTSVTSTNNAAFTGTGITLADQATDTLSVSGNAYLAGETGAISIGPAGAANFGTLTFNTTGAVTIQEDSATQLAGANTANSLSLTSAGAITDAIGTSVSVTNNGTLTGVGITLADQATDVLLIGGNADFEGGSGAISVGPAGTANFGSLTFNSTNSVTIQEDSATQLTGTNTANSLSLTSAGAITDATGTSVSVTNNGTLTGVGITLADQATDVLLIGGNADFEGGGSAIAVGPAGTANFGTLTFNSTSSVSIQEDSATNLTGTNTADSLGLTSAGAITDATGTSVSVTNNGTFSGVGITLADQATDVLLIGGNADFEGGSGAISVGPAGTANFGSLTFNSTNSVTIQEDSATQLTGTNTANSLSLTSAGAITDATGTSVSVTNNGTLTGLGITLADNGTDTLSVGGNADFEGTTGPVSIGPAGTANFGSLMFNSTSSVSIQEDSATNLTGTNTADSLSLTSAGAITDATGTSLTVTNNGTLTGVGITLTDNATDLLSIGGNADFEGGSSAISVGPAGTANFGSLTFNTTSSVSIQEDSATNLTGTNTANSLSLTSAGAITDATGTSVSVTNNGTLTGVGITLTDNATDLLSIGGTADFEGGSGAIAVGPAGAANFGTLTFNTTGSVSIQEDSATNLTGTNTANSLNLTSAGAITDAPGTSVTITNNGTFTGVGITLADNAADTLSIGGNADFEGTTGPVSIGPAGTANFGSLTFNTTGSVSIQEDSATNLTGANTANSLSLTSAGAITDATATSVTVTNNGTLTGEGITLADNAADLLSIGGTAGFQGGSGPVSIGPAGTANFGNVTFNSTSSVTIQEDSATNLTGTNTANNLSLTSAGAITDAAGTSLTVANNGTLTGIGITLADNAADALSIGGNADFEGGSGAITVGPAGTANFGSLTFNSTGSVTIQEDSATQLTGSNTANSLTLTSTGAITDATGTSVTVANNGTLTGAGITLADNAADTLSIGGNADFEGTTGPVSIGPAGTANFGSLTFNTTGSVSIQEDSATNLIGANTANSLTLTSAGAITDATGTSMTVTNNSTLTGVGITLADQTTDLLSIGGNADFEGSSGAISVGPAGTANFGSLTFNSTGSVTIQEDSATNLTGTNTANSLSLTSAGAITDATGTSVSVTNNGTLTGVGITLADNATDLWSVGGTAGFEGTTGAIAVGPAGTANFGSLTFNSTSSVSIQEDSATNLTGTNTANSLSLTSAGAITDVTGTSVTVTNSGTLTGVGITLADNAADLLAIGDTADFEGTTGPVRIGPAGTANFGSLTFNTTNIVNIQEDSATNLTGTNTADSLGLTSTGAITDATGTSVTVTNSGTLTGVGITLADQATDVLSIGGNADFEGGSAAISVGPAGTANFGSLTFNSTSSVSIQEDSATNLTGTNTANSLSLTSAGAITDATGTSVSVTNNGTLTGVGITLADQAADVLSVGGTADFEGTTGPVSIGPAGIANFGSLTFNSTSSVSIQEDSATNLTGTNTAGATARLWSTSDVTQTVGSSVTAETLAVTSDTGNIILASNLNDANHLAAQATNNGAGGKSVDFVDADGFNLTNLAADGGFPEVAGINVTTQAGSVVRLRSGGDITQDSDAPVVADQLGAQATGNIDLCLAPNDVNTLAAQAGGDVSFKDADTFTLGTVIDDGSGTLSAPITGVSGVDINLITNDSLVINIAINTTGTVRLVSLNGSITQTASITAQSLSVQARDFVDLSTQINNVGVFAATAALQHVYYRDADSVTVGQVLNDTDCPDLVDGTGIAAGTNVEIRAGAGIIIDQAVTAGDAVRLRADNGTVTQNAAGAITADQLSVQAFGTGSLIDLNNATNNVNNFVATTLGNIDLLNEGPLTINTDAGGDFVNNPVTGVTATGGGNINIQTNDDTAGDGDLTVLQPVNSTGATFGAVALSAKDSVVLSANVGNANTPSVTVTAENGSISQTTGLVTGDAVAMTAGTAISQTDAQITGNNIVDLTAGTSISQSAGTITSAVITMDAGTDISQAANSQITASNSVTLTAGGGISQSASQITGTNAVDLTAGADITQSSSTITGNVVTLAAGANIAQDTNSEITGNTTVTMTAGGSITQTASQITGPTVTLTAGTFIGATGAIVGLSTQQYNDGTAPGSTPNFADWTTLLNDNGNEIQVNTNALTAAANGGDARINVNPLTSNVEITVNAAAGNVILTSLNANAGTLNLNQIAAGQNILIYTDTNGVALGSLYTLQTTANSIAVDTGGALTKLANYRIATGNTSETPTNVLLQLLPNGIFPANPPADSSTNSGLSDIYADYNFFQVQSPYPSPNEAVIRPMQENSISARYGITGETGWHNTIDWGDGTAPETDPTGPDGALPQQAGGGVYTYSHLYQTTADATYNVNLTVSVDQSISLASHVGTDAPTFYLTRVLETKVIVNPVPPPPIFFLEPELAPPVRGEVFYVHPVNIAQPLVAAQAEIKVIDSSTAVAEKRRFLMLYLVPEDGSDAAAIPVSSDGIKAPNKEVDLEILQGERLIETFKNLPDGRYRLTLYRTLGDEVLDERTVLETVITNGVPSNPLDEVIEQLRRQLERDSDSPVEEDADSGAGMEVMPVEGAPTVSQTDDGLPAKPAATLAAGLLGSSWGAAQTKPQRKAEGARKKLLSR